MNRSVLLACLFLLLSSQPTLAAAGHPAADLRQEVFLSQGTAIQVEAVDAVSSASAKEGMKIRFKVAKEVVCSGAVVIPVNSAVDAVISKVERAGAWGNAGAIEAVFSKLETMDGQSFPVTGLIRQSGELPSIFVRYSLLGVFIQGQEAQIKAGTPATLKTRVSVRIAGAKEPGEVLPSTEQQQISRQ